MDPFIQNKQIEVLPEYDQYLAEVEANDQTPDPQPADLSGDDVSEYADERDSCDYWNDIASDGEADANALESVYGPEEW